jgi:N-acetylmuramoyl-L-alanine amidase
VNHTTKKIICYMKNRIALITKEVMDAERSLRIARYPVRLLHYAELGVFLGCVLAVGIHMYPAKSVWKQRSVWHDGTIAGSNPVDTSATAENSDRDRDGIPNDWETKNSHNPDFAHDAGSDFDGDGLTALQEYQFSLRTDGQKGNPLGKWAIAEIPIEYPDVDTSQYASFWQYGYVVAANDRGDMVVQFSGYGVDFDDASHYDERPFLFSADGSIREINIPGKTSGHTTASDINESGEILLQWYSEDWSSCQSFMIQSDRSVQELTLQGNACFAYRMNNFGDWIGWEIDENGSWLPAQVVNGMRIIPEDQFTSWSIQDINDFGQIIGTYYDMASNECLTFTQMGSMFFSTGREGDFPLFNNFTFRWQWPAAMNRWGEFAGGAYGFDSAGNWRNSTFFYDGLYHDIQGPDDQSYSYPADLTDTGMVLFHSYSSSYASFKPSLWRDSVSVTCESLVPADQLEDDGGYLQPTKISHNGKIFLTRYDRHGKIQSIVTLTPDQDSDKDGMPDEWEEFYGFDPVYHDANLDSDNDGTNNLGEFLLHSDPHTASALNANGLSIDTRPGVDTDGDGVPNNWEVVNGMNYEDPDDAALDFDRDGYTNLQEFCLLTDPRGAPSYRIREIGPLDGVLGADFSKVTLGEHSLSDRSYPISGDQVTDELFFSVTIHPGASKPAIWSQPHASESGVFSLYASFAEESHTIVAQSSTGAVLARHGYHPTRFTYWSSPKAEPMILPVDVTDQNMVDLSNARFSPSGKFLYAVSVNDLGEAKPIVWKMPDSDGVLYKPVAITAPEGASIDNWLIAYINDFGIMTANGMVSGQHRGLVWTFDDSTTKLQSAILPNHSNSAHSSIVGISNHSLPIIAGTSLTEDGQEQATVWKYGGPATYTITTLAALPNGNSSQITKISPNGTLAGVGNVICDNVIKQQIFSASPNVSTNSESIDPALYRLTLQGEPCMHGAWISHLTDGGEIIASIYDSGSRPSMHLFNRGKSHPLESLLPPSSNFGFQEIKAANAQGTLLVTAWKDNALEMLLLIPNRDTDGDGLPDAFENSHQFNPFAKNNPATDTDRDGLNDLLEFAHGTHPRNHDTDGDGIKDGWEVEWGFLPLDASDALLDPDEDRVTNLRESQIGTTPTGVYQWETMHTDTEWNFPYVQATGDDSTIIRSDASQYHGTDAESLYGYQYTQEIVTQKATEKITLPNNQYKFFYNYDWSYYSYGETRGNYYPDSVSGNINGDRVHYNYYYDASTSEYFFVETFHLTPDITHFPNEADWIPMATVEQNLRNSNLHNGNPPVSEFESLYYRETSVSPSGVRRLYSTDWGRQLLLNERGECMALLPTEHYWQKINDLGVAASYEATFEPDSHSYIPWLFLSHGEVFALPRDPQSRDYPDYTVLALSNDGKVLLRNGHKSRQHVWTNRYVLFDTRTLTLNPVRLPSACSAEINTLSNQNGRMLIQGTKPSQITPDGACIGLEAIRVIRDVGMTPVSLRSLSLGQLTPNHITSDGRITLTIADATGQQQIVQLIPQNDANRNGMSDDWETSEIQYLVSADSALWAHLLESGQLDAETRYWGDRLNAKQSFLLGLSQEQRELSKTSDFDSDGAFDAEDADPLDSVVDWKPAGEAAYAVIQLDALSYEGMPTSDPNDPYQEFTASIGDNGIILWNDKIKEISSDGKESWSDRCRVWRSGEWSADIRDTPNIFDSITLSGVYRPDPWFNPSHTLEMSGAASPLDASSNRADMQPSAVCGEMIVGHGSYMGMVHGLQRVVRSCDENGNEIVSTLHDGTRAILSPSITTAWNPSGENPKIWKTSVLGTPPAKDSNSLDLSIKCYDEWQAIQYRAVASSAGALAALGGDHTFQSRKWQVWDTSGNPGNEPSSWEIPYSTENSMLLMKAVSDEGIAVGERIEGHSTYWGKVDSVVIEKGVETILPESSGAFAMGASICRINAGEPGSKSRLAVGGTSLWVQKDNDWHQAEHPPTMSTIIAIAKDGVMLGATTIWRNGTSIPLDELVKNHTISDTNPAPRFTNLRAYAMNGEGAIVAMADDEVTKNTTVKGKVLLMVNPIEVRELSPKLRDENDDEIPGSEKPASGSKSTEMVERDPSVSIYDASTIRIAWRDMKVKVGKNFAGKTVTWTMKPLFIAHREDGTIANSAKFRGKWETASHPMHRYAFSKSEKYGDHEWNPLNDTNESISLKATTKVDNDGYTAIRVNMPPIGLNKARINASIETTLGNVDVIDLEVPAVVVIDPGHGIGNATPSNAIGATGVVTKVSEHEVVMDIGRRMVEVIKYKREKEKLKIKVFITRIDNKNIDFKKRTDIARKNGCDVYVSLHFNGGDTATAYRNPFGMWDKTENFNEIEDRKLATRLRKSVEIAIANVQPEFLKIPVSPYTSDYWENNPSIQKGLDTCSDNQTIKINNKTIEVPYNGNIFGYTPCRSALIEIEWLSNKNADSLFNGETADRMRQEAANEMSNAALEDIKIQPQ